MDGSTFFVLLPTRLRAKASNKNSKMKKNLLTFILLFLTGLGPAQAYDFSAVAPSGQTLYYNIVNGNAEVTYQIKNNNASPNYTSLSGSLTIPASVTYNGTTYSVTSIGDSAFWYCRDNWDITIPNTVTSIGPRAFYHCSGLTSVTIGDSVTSIGDYAFYYCSGLTCPPPISNSVTSIGRYAFYHCYWLTGPLIIPNSVTSIGQYAFCGCSRLTGTLTIPNSVTSIGGSAFDGCSGLTSLDVPDGVSSIEVQSFKNCDHLTNITLGSGLHDIGDEAFSGCTQVVRIKSRVAVAPTVYSNTFEGLSDSVIVNTPCGSATSYENTAYWIRFNIQEELMHNFSATTSDPARGTVTIVTAPSCDNREAQVQANPYHGYCFDHWSDGNTDNPRYIVVMQDTSIVAYFRGENDPTGIREAEVNGGFQVFAHDGQIVVEGAEGMPVMLYDATGRLLATRRSEETLGSTPVQFNVPVSGTYLVRVGNLPAKKVVVIR